MSKNANQKLHLLNLQIKGFRGLRELTIPNLGRVTLLVGRNGVGKTTILEAVKLWARRGKSTSVARLLSDRDEYGLAADDNGDIVSTSSISPLFFGRNPSSGSKIEIGPANGSDFDKLTIKIVNGSDSLPKELKANRRYINNTGANFTCTTFGDKNQYSIWHGERFFDNTVRRGKSFEECPDERYFEDYRDSALESNKSGLADSVVPTTVACISLGPEQLEGSAIAKYLESIALTNDEDRATRALNIAIGENVECLASVHHDRDRYGPSGSRVIVRLNQDNPRVPLKSLGSGATRLLSVALALSRSENGFLVIDEVENGIHHTVHENLWKMIMKAAIESNVQVIATTHSFDCIVGFARAATANGEVDGVLIRIEKDTYQTKAVSFDKTGLQSIEKHRFEVR